jgi:hypothetical protein
MTREGGTVIYDGDWLIATTYVTHTTEETDAA